MMTRRRLLAATAVLALSACGGREAADTPADTPADAAFAALQERGAAAMGVDQYTSSHIFEDLPDGGRIVLQRDSVDAEGTATIRAHMQDIAARFADGDFSIPGMVHDQVVPGTAVMAARRALIAYAADTLPRGAQVRITTTDAEAVRAVHEFLAFQRMDHRAAGHATHDMPH
jgi:hypothetical protein